MIVLYLVSGTELNRTSTITYSLGGLLVMPKYELYYRGNLLRSFDSIDDATDFYSQDSIFAFEYEIKLAR